MKITEYSAKRLQRAIVSLLLATLCVLSVLFGTLRIQANAASAYKNWKQYGESWSSLKLGTSGETVAQSGCAVISASMLMMHSGSAPDGFTPDQLINYLNSHNGFSSGGDLYWAKIADYAPDFQYVDYDTLPVSKTDKIARIQELLDEGYYLIVNVNSGRHFVAIESVSGGKVIMMDPGSSGTSLFDTYAASGVITLRVFQGKNSGKSQQGMTNPPAPKMTNPNLPAMTNPPAPEMTDPTMPEMTAPPAPEASATAMTNPPAPEVPAAPTAPNLPEPEMTNPPAPEVPETPTAPNLPEPEMTNPPAPEVPETPTAPNLPEPEMTNPPAPEMAVSPVPPMPSASLKGLTDEAYIYITLTMQTTANLNLRDFHSLDAPIQTVLPEGTMVTITAVTKDQAWARVAFGDTEGWISLEYMN